MFITGFSIGGVTVGISDLIISPSPAGPNTKSAWFGTPPSFIYGANCSSVTLSLIFVVTITLYVCPAKYAKHYL
ncbi:hypothetical protein ACSXEY_16765 (plasmid) [Clostridium perfringens]